MKAAEQEMNIIKKLCGPNTHQNIVQVLNHGILCNCPYYFIDMELCDLSLELYIQRTEPPNPSEALPHFIKDGGSDLTVLQIWNVMRQIASGVEYIHSQEHTHRDIKPANSPSQC